MLPSDYDRPMPATPSPEVPRSRRQRLKARVTQLKEHLAPRLRGLSWGVIIVGGLATSIALWPIGLTIWDLLGLSSNQSWRVGAAVIGAGLLAAGIVGVNWNSTSPVRLFWLILAAWTVAAGSIGAMTGLAWLVLDTPQWQPPEELTPRNLDAIATRAFAIVAGLGGVALLVISYRRQRTTEDGEEREVSKLFTDTFDSASEKLGSEHAAVRLAGVHALAQLADEAPKDRDDLAQMVIDVLCAYLRMPYTPAPGPLSDHATAEQAQAHHERELEFAALREVRHTIIRIIGNRLRKESRWRGKNYDFTGTVFDGGDLTGSHFTGGEVFFIGAQFTGGKVSFEDAHFTGGSVDFSGAHFSGRGVSFSGALFIDGSVDFSRAQFTGTRIEFDDARFTGATVNFNESKFTGATANFEKAQFSSGTVYFGFQINGPKTEVNFNRSEFTGATVNFERAQFSMGMVYFDAHFASGTVHFQSQFTGAIVYFNGSKFTGATVHFARANFTSGTVDFDSTLFTDGAVNFSHANFSGATTDFAYAEFNGGKVNFRDAWFKDGTMNFTRAKFTAGTVDFTLARFEGLRMEFDGAQFTGSTADFNNTRFTNGRVDFSRASGTCPRGLLNAKNTGVLALPERWQPTADDGDAQEGPSRPAGGPGY